jgi:hypothetical protein
MFWLFSAVYSDRYFQATLDLVLFAALLGVTGNIHLADTWQYVLQNPVSILGFGVAYLGLGILWSLVKWRLMLRRFKALLREAGFDDKMKQRIAETGGKDMSLPWHLGQLGLQLKEGKIRLEVDNFKTKIVGWMTYWWVSMPVWVVGDALHELFETIYLSVRRFYQQMADSSLND